MRHTSNQWRALAILLLIPILLAAACAPAASAFPTKPVTLIVPFDAGGGPDTTFRVLAEEAGKALGQKVVVVNRPGGAGTVGVTELIQSKPDGYTVSMCPVAVLNVQPLLQDVPYKGPGDVLPLVASNEAPMVLYVKADSPFKTLKDLVDEAKKRPGKVTIGNVGGNYNVPHADLILLQKEAGIQVKIVPYGSSDHLPAVLGGTIEASTGQVAMMSQHIKAGTVRALGVFYPNRVTSLPDVPTFKEQGYDVSLAPYEFVIAPKGLTPEVKGKLVDAFTTAAKSQAFKDYIDKQGAILAYVGPDDLAKKLAADADKYKQLVEEAGWQKQN
ncbi:MAG: tripartite tricarboxylate transporter substrate binding protein [Chloroflexota bacterium]